MKQRLLILAALLAVVVFAACAVLEQASGITGQKDDPEEEASLTEATIIKALKDALSIGISNAVEKAGMKDGFLMDEAIKILLPPEADSGINRIKNNSDIKKLVETGLTAASGGSYRKSFEAFLGDMLVAINRSAENSAAAPETLKIFKEAITGLTIRDGLEILKGNVPGGYDGSEVKNSPNAATLFLKKQTYSQLKTLFASIIDAALNEKIPDLGYSTNDFWKWYVAGVNFYNNEAKVSIGPLTISASDHYGKVETPPATLGNYVTAKALDALFLKLEAMEENIRREIRVPKATAALIEAFEYARDNFNLF